MSKKKPYSPPIPMERLKAMQFALLKHIYAGQADGFEPLGREMAIEIEEAIALLIQGPPRPRRATNENLRAAAVARFAISALKVPQEVAVAAAFENPNGVDVGSLARTYRNLLPVLTSDTITSAEMNRWLTAYYRTDYYKKRKRAGKIKGK